MHALFFPPPLALSIYNQLIATYKYPMLSIAIRVALVRTLTCRVKIIGIGSDANSTSVKKLIAILVSI